MGINHKDDHEWLEAYYFLPGEEIYCWICDLDGNVLDGQWRFEAPHYSYGSTDPKYKPGFIIAEEDGSCIFPDEIRAWMPYFTPLPPI